MSARSTLNAVKPTATFPNWHKEWNVQHWTGVWRSRGNGMWERAFVNGLGEEVLLVRYPTGGYSQEAIT